MLPTHRPMRQHQDPHADLAAAFACLDHALDTLAQYATIQTIDRKTARIAFYAPRPIRPDDRQIRPGIHRLNWPDRRRWRTSSHTFRQWIAELEAHELTISSTRFRAVALFNRTLTLETEHPRTLYRWMRVRWHHHPPLHPLTIANPPYNQASQGPSHVRRARRHPSAGCETRPATVAPAGWSASTISVGALPH